MSLRTRLLLPISLLVVWLLVFAGAWMPVDLGVRRQDAARPMAEFYGAYPANQGGTA